MKRIVQGFLASLASLASLALFAAPAPAQSAAPLAWSHDWKLAQESAAAAKRPILVVVMKDDEPGCTRMTEKVLVDPAIRAKLEAFVLVPASNATHKLIEVERSGRREPSCPQFVGALCSEHQAIERELHARLVEQDRPDVILAPQCLVLDAGGTLLLRRPYEMKRQGFLEFLEYGLALFADPKLASQPGVRSPFVQKLEEAIVKAPDDPAREKATRDLLDEPSPEREVAFLDAVEKVSGQEHKEPIVRAAGWPEYKAWAPTLVKLLDSNVAWVRNCAVVSLEEIGEPLAGPPLLSLWEREKDGETKKDLLRALGPCGGGRPAVRTLLLAQLDAAKDPWRSAAAMSLGGFTKGDAEVAGALEKRYAKEKSATVRLAILSAFLTADDAAQRDRIEAMTKAEKDAAVADFATRLKARLAENPGARPNGPPGADPGGRGLFGFDWQLQKLLAPLYADDKVVRNRIKAWKKSGKGGKDP
jgi:HEAT repeat protein